jgi:methylmalonyl-CoA mutase cobalamin-binding subunit
VASRATGRGAEVLAEGRGAGPASIHRTAYLRREGAASEAEVKLRARRSGRITYHAHVGSTDWPTTAAALREVEAGLAERGQVCDRFGLTLSRAMSVDEGSRERVHKETGPALRPEEWDLLGEAAAIQPHLGDFMIGTPAGAAHARLALASGVTTIGNLGQYWSFEVPGGQDDRQVTEATVRAVGMLAAWRDRGALVHSYLDDGVAMQASTYGSYVGWAALERHVVEDLCGARLAHSYGGLVDDPWHRAVVHLAVDDVHDRDHLGSMVYGDTVSMRPHDHAHNAEVLRRYLTVDLACQLRRPTGHAVHPVPLTEAERVPTGPENLAVQLVAHELADDVRRSAAVLDWAAAEALAAEVAAYARQFRDRALALLVEDGVRVDDPVALLLALRGLGVGGLEERLRLPTPRPVADLVPWKARQVGSTVAAVAGAVPDLRGTRVVLAVLDVHDVVRDALLRLLPGAGAEVVLLPSSATPASVVHAAVAEDADAVVLGTYNGAALDVGRELRAALDEVAYDGLVIMGGRLNQDLGGEAPVEVADDLRALGLHPAATVEEACRLLARSSSARRDREFT